MRLQPYQVVFNAVDNGEPVNLQDYRTMNITVVAPAPQNPMATPSGGVHPTELGREHLSNATGYQHLSAQRILRLRPGPL